MEPQNHETAKVTLAQANSMRTIGTQWSLAEAACCHSYIDIVYKAYK